MYLRRLNSNDPAALELVTGMVMATPGYALSSFGRFPERSDGLNLLATFHSSCAEEDRLVYVAFERADAVGLIRVARHWPSPEISTIGLLLVDPAHQRMHHGCEMLTHLSRQARRWASVRTWRIFVLDTNAAGLHFWHHAGFAVVRGAHQEPGFMASGAVMERPVKQRPLCANSGKLSHHEKHSGSEMQGRLNLPVASGGR